MINLVKEKEKIYEWASANNESRYCFSQPDLNEKSYYKKYETQKDKYLIEYNLETLSEMKEVFNKYWSMDEHMQEIQKVLLIAMLKGKQWEEVELLEENAEKNTEIKEYIYMF